MITSSELPLAVAAATLGSVVIVFSVLCCCRDALRRSSKYERQKDREHREAEEAREAKLAERYNRAQQHAGAPVRNPKKQLLTGYQAPVRRLDACARKQQGSSANNAQKDYRKFTGLGEDSYDDQIARIYGSLSGAREADLEAGSPRSPDRSARSVRSVRSTRSDIHATRQRLESTDDDRAPSRSDVGTPSVGSPSLAAIGSPDAPRHGAGRLGTSRRSASAAAAAVLGLPAEGGTGDVSRSSTPQKSRSSVGHRNPAAGVCLEETPRMVLQASDAQEERIPSASPPRAPPARSPQPNAEESPERSAAFPRSGCSSPPPSTAALPVPRRGPGAGGHDGSHAPLERDGKGANKLPPRPLEYDAPSPDQVCPGNDLLAHIEFSPGGATPQKPEMGSPSRDDGEKSLAEGRKPRISTPKPRRHSSSSRRARSGSREDERRNDKFNALDAELAMETEIDRAVDFALASRFGSDQKRV